MEKSSLAFKNRDSNSLHRSLIPSPESGPSSSSGKHSQHTQKSKRDAEKLDSRDRGDTTGAAALYIPPNQQGRHVSKLPSPSPPGTKDPRSKFATGRRAGPDSTADATASMGGIMHLKVSKGQRQGEGQRGSSTLMGILDRNFASSAAVRDFNESMPIIVPSNFSPENGTVAVSRPSDRVTE